ncbi:MAG: hypothetical protein MJ058_08545 [Akkermansia sp.]|nr:hypothetical protein [Akkermansia sp.]
MIDDLRFTIYDLQFTIYNLQFTIWEFRRASAHDAQGASGETPDAPHFIPRRQARSILKL